ncbi:MAG TPA: hypothetical protein VMT10_08625 [Solirubrobacteraceae bacterium]|nr:hypothetical protein [Solirubrobacteraceae bacterium]
MARHVIVRMMPRTRALIPAGAFAAALSLAVAGCGGGGASTTRSATTAPATTTTSATTTTTPAAALPGASTRPVRVEATNKTTALLSAIRAARHPGYDRIVFQFRNVLPGYDVRYVPKPLHEDASGRPIPIAGAYALQVRMLNALDADLSKPGVPRTYTGPTSFMTPNTAQVVQMARTGGFENVLTWAAGLRSRVPFRVTTLQSPARLVVDVRSG